MPIEDCENPEFGGARIKTPRSCSGRWMLLRKWPGSAGIPACNSEIHLKAEASFSTPEGEPLTELPEGFLLLSVQAHDVTVLE
jgi:hypothetical protein